MKKFYCILIVAVACVAMATPASAGLRFGIKAGVAVNSIKFESDSWQDTFTSSNRAGFTGGLMTEFTVPVLGLGFDASVMYMHRGNTVPQTVQEYTHLDASRDYIDIPINLKWKFNIPVVQKVLKPYITTGPSFAFLVSKNDFKDFVKQQKCDFSWNFGFGVEVLSKVQVGASYGFSLNNTMESTKIINSEDIKPIEGKNKYWTITAAYLF